MTPQIQYPWVSGSGLHPLSISGMFLQERIGQQKITQQKNESRRSGDKNPGVQNQRVILAGISQHAPPTRHGFADSQAEERKRHLRQDVLRDQHRRLGQQEPGGFRQDMSPDQVEWPGTKSP